MHDFLILVRSLLRQGIGLAILAAGLCCAALGVAYGVFRSRTKGSRKFPWGKAVTAVALVGYVAVLLYATLLRYTGGEGRFEANLHLLRGWREAWNSWSLQGWLNVLLNVAMFVPLGVLLPLLWERMRKWYVLLAAGFGSSLFIEAVQYLSGRGLLDVDDLFANTLGAALGYCAVMAFQALLDRRMRSWKRCLGYLACPLAFAAVLAGLFGYYQLKPYGNLPEASAFAADTRNVAWELRCGLEDTGKMVSVYRTEPLDKAACDAFGAAFAVNAGITFPDAYYYDSFTLFANHATGDFLQVNYRDGSYKYDLGTDTWGMDAAQVDEAALRELLQPYGISVPEDADFRYDGHGMHTFTVEMQASDGGLLDGMVSCFCKGDGILDQIENNLVTFRYCGDEPVISETQAYERLCGGKFSGGDYFEYWKPERVALLSCALDYRVDTKGFYQPVYVFAVSDGGEAPWEIVIPALK